MHTIDTIRRDIAALHNVTYLNWGGSGPSPMHVVDTECTAIRTLNDLDGPMAVTALQAADTIMTRTRADLARFLGCKREEIALMESTSDGINRIAWGIEWQRGDEVLISDLEHVSGVAPWVYLQDRFGIRVIEVPSIEGQINAEMVLEKVTAHTKLVFISHVSYTSGSTLPVAELAAQAEAKGFWLGIDGAQAVGAIPVNLSELGVHFYALPGQKWLLGPDGTGALFVRQDMLEVLRPSYVGWASLHEEALHGGKCRFHESARRYEVAGRRVPAFAALAEAVRTIDGIGMTHIHARIAYLTGYLKAKLAEVPGVAVWGAATGGKQSGLVSVALPHVDPARVVKTMWETYRIVVRWVGPPRLLRFSLHAFNTEDDVDYAVQALGAILRKVNKDQTTNS